MTYVTALLPVAQGVGVYAALKRAADTTFDDRSRGRVMADTLVERVTGRPAETPEPVAVNLVISDQTLLGGDNSPAVVEVWAHPGRGGAGWSTRPSPMNDRGPPCGGCTAIRRPGRWWRWVAVAVLSARVGGIDRLRDQRCRTPYCDAPIRHRDHAEPHNRGGPTSALNGLGSCERCNYAKEAPGWRVTTNDESGVHTAEFVTRRSTLSLHGAAIAGLPAIVVSEVEARIGIASPTCTPPRTMPPGAAPTM